VVNCSWAINTCGRTLEVVRRLAGEYGFKVLPRRWVVERTFGWLNRYCRLGKDSEKLPYNHENMIDISMIDIMLKRLA